MRFALRLLNGSCKLTRVCIKPCNDRIVLIPIVMSAAVLHETVARIRGHPGLPIHAALPELANQRIYEIGCAMNADLIDAVQWPAMAVTLLASWMVASPSKRVRNGGFGAFLLSNVLWTVWAWHVQAFALIALQIGLVILNIRGAWKARRSHSPGERVIAAPNPRTNSGRPLAGSVSNLNALSATVVCEHLTFCVPALAIPGQRRQAHRRIRQPGEMIRKASARSPPHTCASHHAWLCAPRNPRTRERKVANQRHVLARRQRSEPARTAIGFRSDPKVGAMNMPVAIRIAIVLFVALAKQL